MKAAALYHLGKISSYALIGTLFGLLTSFISSFTIQSWVTIIAGIFIGILAFVPALINYIEQKGFRALSSVIKFKNKINQSIDKERLEYGFYIGFFNGFIPCGLVYIAALAAMVQPTVVESVLFMMLFGIGTVPFLSLVIFASGFFKSKFKLHSAKARTIAFVGISIFMIWKGYQHLNTEIQQPKEGENFQICHQ